MDTVIANKLESAIDKAMQSGFDQLRKTVDLGLVSGEIKKLVRNSLAFSQQWLVNLLILDPR